MGMQDELKVENRGNFVKYSIGAISTNWIKIDDGFVERISDDKINPFFKTKHLIREIESKNLLDEGINNLKSEKFKKAINLFDKILFYDENYTEALINKSYALYGQRHYVKSLRFYRKAIKSGLDKDIEYHKLLLKKSNEERESFPKIKRNIYAGDEAAAKGEFERALEFYEKALADQSGFKNKILFKLLNKKAFILIKLKRFDESLASFDVSLRVHENDLAYFGCGFCEYKLGYKCENNLKRAVKIGKKHLLKKALIYNELELYEESLEIFNIFLDYHFALDFQFKSAVEGKINALDGLKMDSRFERMILSSFKVTSY